MISEKQVQGVVLAVVCIILTGAITTAVHKETKQANQEQKANEEKVDLGLEVMSRIARNDCMDLWGYKMAAVNRMRHTQSAKMAKLSPEDYTVGLFETEYNCEVESRLGERFGAEGTYVCGPSLLSTKAGKGCSAYSVVSPAKEVAHVENELAKDAGCRTHLLTPESTTNVKSYNHQNVYAARHSVRKGYSPLYVARTPSKTIDGSLKSINEAMEDQGRIDFLRIKCPGCDTQFYRDIFRSIETGELTVSQMVIEMKNSNPEVLKLVLEAKNKLGYVVTRKELLSHCEGRCADISLVRETETKRMAQLVYCGDASKTLGNHVF